jgi:type IV pilus assembly protein PilM
MAATRGVWAIDIGTNALKALRMREGEEGLEVIGFDYVEHSKVLSSGEVDTVEKEQIIVETLQKFLSQNEIGKEEVAISIAGQNSFARFIKLPPVEPKKIPEIVQFEAVQQIPFDINEVEWDWQLMENPDSPDTEVGIFAIKNELIAEVMDHFTHEKIRVTQVQIAPMALYNYAFYDRREIAESPNKAVIILDMGAENTTLVICTRDSVWQRSIRIGGNTFTQAIADAFKLNFQKAEKLKRTAPVSKYMRQIYTAMKPVYTELGGEIQRSLGFYSSSAQGRDKTFTHLIGTGGGMKLQGLAKYLQQTLGFSVVKPDSFERLKLSSDVSTAKFHENVSDFAVVYGLGVQLIGQAKIQTNLLPRKIARAMAWTRKARVFTIAAGILVLVMLLGLVRAYKDIRQYDSNRSARSEAAAAISQVQQIKNEISEQEGRKQPLLDTAKKHQYLFLFRDVVPKLNETILACLPNAENTPEQAALYEAFRNGDVAGVVSVPRKERKQLFITRLMVESAPDISAAPFPKPDTTGGGIYQSRPQLGKGAAQIMADPFMMQMMRGGGGVDPGIMQGMPGAPAQPQENKAGFVLLIEGYSPYEKIAELLDPPGVGEDKSRWGVITRFENLNKLIPNIPFELFEKGDIKHFKVETGRVEAGVTAMPAGIGVMKEVERVPKELVDAAAGATRRPAGGGGIMEEMMMMTGPGGAPAGRPQERVTVEKVLFDPMTQEEMSRTYDIYTREEVARNSELSDRDIGRKKLTSFGGEQFIERDHWFRIQIKFIWKDAVKVAKPQDASGTGMTPGMF